ncbi:GNAT family N-acetyltransferase [Tenacibaculum geojense]|uniref:GNAT family N-acetyltransferase n=1 Tax=Tenacibaculum geojense TaxID=915352 RepID=A0ABW3JT28_9FLAO
MNMKVYETERLFLRFTTVDDAPFIYKLLNSPKWIQFIGDRNIKTVNDAVNYINKRMLSQLEKLGHSNFTVIRKSDNVKIGSCGLYDREGIDGLDIGFAFLPDYEGKGYAFEAANFIKNLGFKEFNVDQLSAITLEENISSQKLLKKLGLTFERYIKIPNDDEELMLFKL